MDDNLNKKFLRHFASLAVKSFKANLQEYRRHFSKRFMHLLVVGLAITSGIYPYKRESFFRFRMRTRDAHFRLTVPRIYQRFDFSKCPSMRISKYTVATRSSKIFNRATISGFDLSAHPRSAYPINDAVLFVDKV